MNCLKFELNLAFIQHIYEFLFFLHLIAFILSHISMLNQISYFPSESFVKRGLDTKIIDVLFLFFYFYGHNRISNGGNPVLQLQKNVQHYYETILEASIKCKMQYTLIHR